MPINIYCNNLSIHLILIHFKYKKYIKTNIDRLKKIVDEVVRKWITRQQKSFIVKNKLLRLIKKKKAYIFILKTVIHF